MILYVGPLFGQLGRRIWLSGSQVIFDAPPLTGSWGKATTWPHNHIEWRTP